MCIRDSQTLIELEVPRFVFSSSCAVYGDQTEMPIDEMRSINPQSPYGPVSYTHLVNASQHEIEKPNIIFGNLQINENTHEARLGGELLELTSKEFALLSFIASSPRQVYSRAQLLEHVWSSSSEWQNEATVTEHIRRLRAKIEEDPDHPMWIKTVRGVGYRFEPQVAS